jgi:hypothetical protein
MQDRAIIVGTLQGAQTAIKGFTQGFACGGAAKADMKGFVFQDIGMKIEPAPILRKIRFGIKDMAHHQLIHHRNINPAHREKTQQGYVVMGFDNM